MTKRKDSGINFDPIEDEATGLSSTMNNSGPSDPHMLPSGLKPKLDLIFSEVEKKLPDIDFDFSDVDSDSEEPVIFHHHLKSLSVEEDKDLDTSQNEESFSSLTTIDLSNAIPTYSKTDTEEDNKNTPPTVAPINLYDNDLAYELQQSGFSEVSSWGEIPVHENKNTNRIPKSDWSTPSHDESHDKSRDKSVSSWGEIPTDRSVKEVDSNKVKEEGRVEGLSLNSLDDKYIRKQLDREKTRSKEKDLATNIVSPRAPILSTQILENIDLDTLLQNLSTDNQYAPPAPTRQAWNTENVHGSGEGRNITPNSGRGGSDGSTLIQKLAQMSMDKYGDDLSDIDPTTGASKSNVPDNDAAARARRTDSNLGDDVDPVSTTIEQPLISQSQLEKMEAALNSRIEGFLDPFLNSRPKPVENKPSHGASIKPPVKPAVKKNVASCGTNTSDFKEYCITPRVANQANKDQPRKGNKEPTVFIDLRNFDQMRQEQEYNIKRVQKVLGINPTDSTRPDNSDSDDDDDWREQRKKIKQGTIPGQRASSAPVRNKPPTGAVHPRPPRVINMADLPARMRPRGEEEDQPEDNMLRTEIQKQIQIQQREKEKQQEAVRILREKKEQERQTKLRLQKRLEALKPSASVSGRQDPAEITPIVFDMDASYEPAPHSLPPVLSPDMETLLLTIHLSSNGEIVLHRGSGNKSVDTGRGLSASYTTLLTWLLTLVPDNFTYMQDAPAAGEPAPWILPFYVVGLQQALMDDQLCLMVAVTPVEQFDAKYIPVKGKKAKKIDSKGSSAFLQHLTKFFSVNTLHSVCPWLQNMVSMEVAPVAEGDGDSKPGYVYKPPLPNITTKPLSTFIQINPDKQSAAKVFNTQVGFFWQTVDSDEARMDQDLHDDDVSYDTQNTISLVYKKIYRDPSAVMGILNRVLQLGLDLAGARLVYPTPELMNLPKSDNSLSDLDLLNNIGGVLALCIRGHAARSIWLDAIGPSDPALARRTDPNSLCALYGGESRDECLLFCPRTPARVHTELVRWFGGRVPAGNVIDVGTPYTKKETLRGGSPKGKRTKKVTFSDTASSSDTSEGTKSAEILSDYHRPLAALTATTKSEIFLAFSPLVPPKCFGLLIASCQRRGYQISGIKRCRLSTKKAAALGITGEGVETFCPGSGSERFSESLADHVVPGQSVRLTEALFPSTLFLLQKENACHSAASLIEDGMVQLTLNGIMGTIQSRVGFPLGSQHMIHAGRYSDSLLTALGGDFSKCFDPEIQINPSYVIPKLYTNPELEQITVLLLLGHDILKSSGLFVGKLLNLIPYSKSQQTLPFAEGLELLGMKWLANLTNTQAKEVTPCEVGDRLWKESLHTLTNEPCMVLALRGVNVFKCLEKVVQPRVRTNKQGQPYHYDTLHARNAEEAYTLIRLFFTERELFSDPLSRPLSPYIPTVISEHLPERKTKQTSAYPMEESIFDIMLAGPQPFSTFLVVKPRAFQKHLIKILKKLNQEGFTIVGLKLQILTAEQANHLIAEDTEVEERQKHLRYLASGPSLCMSVQRENAVKKLLDLLGPEDPHSARRLSQFYWRGVFGADKVANGIYASSDYENSVQDQRLFFPDGLCCEESDITLQEQMDCPALDKEMYVKHASIRDVVTQSVQATGSSTSDSHQLLLQTTCLVLPPILMKKLGPHHGYVDVIDGLVSQGFEFVGGRMVWFTPEQAEHFLCLVDAGNFHQVPMLTSGGSIILALQRDNAVVAFDSLLRETFSTESCQGISVTDSLLHKYGPLILRPTDVKQAHNLLGFFFDDLLPSSQVQVLPKLE